MTRSTGLLLACAVALAACAPKGERPPHLVLISLDTLNRSALRAYDEDAQALPAIDAFCAESLRFDRAYSAASWTLPSHGSLFTGLYPDRHGATDRRVTLASDVLTLAEGLARRGYETAGINGGGYLSEEYGMGRGFEHYSSFQREKKGPSETGAGLVARVRGFLRERGESARPLFLFLHSYAVHNYYDVRPELVRELPDASFLSRKAYIDCALGRGACDPRAWGQMERLYDAELVDFDRAFGELRAMLEEAGIWDDAVVVFTTDHGEGFEPERQRKHHGGRLHADQLHIPLLVRLPPGGSAPGVVDAPVSLVDVLPTFLDLAGAPVPSGLDGRSFAPLLTGEGELRPRPIYAMEHYFRWSEGKRLLPEGIEELPVSSAVIDEGSWYIRHASGLEELFDAEGDLEQREDLAPGGAGIEGLRALLEQRDGPRTETRPRGAAPGVDQDLKALGYVGEEE